MAESFSKKPKVMPPRAPRIRYSIQLEVEAGMEERLEALKSKIQRVKSALRITSRTPMGNLLMMERLLSSLFLQTLRCEASYLQWQNMAEGVLYVATL